jgi:hypothetical protein
MHSRRRLCVGEARFFYVTAEEMTREPPQRSPEAIRRYAALHFGKKTDLRWLRRFVTEWWSGRRVARERGFPLDVLRELGGRGKLQQRVLGRKIYYCIAEVDKWLDACPELAEAERLDALTREFIASGKHAGDRWALRKDVSSAFRRWCLERVGALPRGWKSELWRQIRADGRFRETWHILADRRRARTLAGWVSPRPRP